MSRPEFGSFPGDDSTVPELIDYVVMLQKTIEFQLAGNLDSVNAREFGGWHIGREQLASKNGMVGLSTAITTENDLRIWAGSTTKNTAAFRVYEDGFVFLSKLLVQTSVGYPRIELDSTKNEFSINSSANNGIRMSVDPVSGFAQLQFTSTAGSTIMGFGGGGTGFVLANMIGSTTIQTQNNLSLDAVGAITMKANGNINLQQLGNVIIQSFNKIYSLDQNQSLGTIIATFANKDTDIEDDIRRNSSDIDLIFGLIMDLDNRITEMGG